MLILIFGGGVCMGGQEEAEPAGREVSLPKPDTKGAVSLETAIGKRRSVREYARAPLTLAEVSQVLWAAQGVTDRKEGLRAAPSAGALYPLEFTLVAGKVEGLDPGIYRYRPLEHDLVRISGDDPRADLAAAAWGQDWLKKAPLLLAVSAVYERTTKKYGERGKRYVHMDAGYAMENVYLQATALGLGTVTVGAFDDRKVASLLTLPRGERPLALMPMGRLRRP